MGLLASASSKGACLLLARLGPPGTSAFPPLVGAKRTSVGKCERSRFMSAREIADILDGKPSRRPKRLSDLPGSKSASGVPRTADGPYSNNSGALLRLYGAVPEHPASRIWSQNAVRGCRWISSPAATALPQPNDAGMPMCSMPLASLPRHSPKLPTYPSLGAAAPKPRIGPPSQMRGNLFQLVPTRL